MIDDVTVFAHCVKNYHYLFIVTLLSIIFHSYYNVYIYFAFVLRFLSNDFYIVMYVIVILKIHTQE